MDLKCVKLINKFLVFQKAIPRKPCDWDVPFLLLEFQSHFYDLPAQFLFPLDDSLDSLSQLLPFLLIHAISNKNKQIAYQQHENYVITYFKLINPTAHLRTSMLK